MKPNQTNESWAVARTRPSHNSWTKPDGTKIRPSGMIIGGGGGRGREPKGTETDPISRVDNRVGRLDRRDGNCCAGDEIDVSYPVPSDKSTRG